MAYQPPYGVYSNGKGDAVFIYRLPFKNCYNMEGTDKSAEIVIFDNPQFGQIRTTVNEKGEPLFALSDVCKALGLKNPQQVRVRLSQKGVITVDTPTKGGIQKLTYVNEPNLYRCVFQSRKATAETFQDWVFEEVLPSIRKTGSYNPGLPAPALPTDARLALTLQESAMSMADALSCGYRHDFFDYLQLTMMSASFYTVATDYGWTVMTLLDQLAEQSVMLKYRDAQTGVTNYELSPRFNGKGYLQKRREEEHIMIGRDYEPKISFEAEWTPKGRCFIYGVLRMAGILPVMERNLQMLSQPKQ